MSGSSYKEVKLPAGERDLSWARYFDGGQYCKRKVVTLEAGHVYELGFEGRRRGLFGDLAALWVEDTVTHEIITGWKPESSLLPGQVNPPIQSGFRRRVERHFIDECVSATGDSDPEVLKRRR